jgi:hypothetical protein
MVVKESVIRGSRKLFRTTITDTSGNPQNPDPGTCFVRLEKVGEYRYDSPSQWYPCVNVGGIGVFGSDIWLPNSWTLGDWLARFRWEISGVVDYDSFEFVLKRKDKPWQHKRGPKL